MPRKRVIPDSDVQRQLRDTRRVYTADLGKRLLDAYYARRGSLREACQDIGVPYATAKRWLKEQPALHADIELVKELIRDQVHSAYMSRVMNVKERNPAYQIFFLKNHDPRYAEKAKPINVKISLSDSTLRRGGAKVIDTTAAPATPALTDGSQPRPDEPVEAEAHTG